LCKIAINEYSSQKSYLCQQSASLASSSGNFSTLGFLCKNGGERTGFPLSLNKGSPRVQVLPEEEATASYGFLAVA